MPSPRPINFRPPALASCARTAAVPSSSTSIVSLRAWVLGAAMLSALELAGLEFVMDDEGCEVVAKGEPS